MPSETHAFVLILDRQLDARQVTEIVMRNHDVGIKPGGRAVMFQRETPTMVDAVVSAIQDVEMAGVRVIRVDAQDWLTLADIAARIGRSREIVRLWSIGRQGPGGFPPPLNPGRDTSFYSWAEVAPWLRLRMGYQVWDEQPALTAANLAVQLRWLGRRTPHASRLRDILLFD
jgi:hypothetical protein